MQFLSVLHALRCANHVLCTEASVPRSLLGKLAYILL